MSPYDYVIVGGGTAGCVLAARLTEDPSLRVLLLEAGAAPWSPVLRVPLAEMLWTGHRRYDWRFSTRPDPTIDGRSLRIPRGRLLGGSNAINGMLFVRGQPEDYDAWAAAGNPGWGWADVLPHFRRVEGADDAPAGGRGGPIVVGPPRERDELTDVYLRAAGQAGHASNDDYNAGVQDGVGYYQVTHDRGRRSSVVNTYLADARHRPNLVVVTKARVTRLRFDGRRCVGVHYRAGDDERDVDCGREVLLAAGVIQSPQILELSGIGRSELLRAVGLPIVHHLPGVGENFRDHYAVRLKWRVRRPVTLNERTRGLRLAREACRYVLVRRGALTLPVALGFGFVRSSANELRPDIQLHFSPASYSPARGRLERAPGMTLGVYPLRPESRGSVHVGSAEPTAPPVIEPRFLDDASDCARLIQGARLARQIVARPAFDPYRSYELSPGDEVQSDDELLAFARAHGDTSYHPVGTCRMGSDAMAVVDHRLRVRGVERLRVIDGSVMPTLVSGNTNAAVLMIAEKGAAMVLQDGGLATRRNPGPSRDEEL